MALYFKFQFPDVYKDMETQLIFILILISIEFLTSKSNLLISYKISSFQDLNSYHSSNIPL